MRNARLGESQTGIKIAGRNINNVRYTDDTTLTAECEEELKSLVMKMKEKSEKAGLKLKLESRFLEEISMTSDMQMIPPLWQKMKRN